MTSRKQVRHLNKLNANQEGSNNRNWKGDDAGYQAKHLWVRSHLKKERTCPMCELNPPKEVANLDGKYSRDLNTWTWVCRRCHLIMDDVANKAWKTKKGGQ